MRTKAEIREDDAEDYLYEFVNEHSGFSIYEISKRLGWSTGKVSHAIKKLEEDGLIRSDRSVEEERAQTKIRPIGWKELLPDDVGNNEVGKFRGWLQKKKGYSFTTARMYDEVMRTVEQEHLTTESVGDIYWNSPHHRRTRLRHAVRLLDEYYDE